MNTPGKGPFAKQTRDTSGIEFRHWDVPAVELTEARVAALLNALASPKYAPTREFFLSLVNMTPQHRLARNLTSVIRCAADRQVGSALHDGLLPSESDHLRKLEELGISIELLGVAHQLFDLQERNDLATVFNAVFHERRVKRKLW